MTAEERLIEWAKSLHHEPWNYWPSVSVLGRIRDEGAGASQGTAGDRDGGMAALLDRLDPPDGLDCVAQDRRCAEVREAVYAMPPKLAAIVDAGYRCASERDTPRNWQGAVGISGLSQATYFRRRKQMLAWLAGYLCLSEARKAAA